MKAQHALKGPTFFLFSVWVGEREFFHFVLVNNIFFNMVPKFPNVFHQQFACSTSLLSQVQMFFDSLHLCRWPKGSQAWGASLFSIVFFVVIPTSVFHMVALSYIQWTLMKRWHLLNKKEIQLFMWLMLNY